MTNSYHMHKTKPTNLHHHHFKVLKIILLRVSSYLYVFNLSHKKPVQDVEQQDLGLPSEDWYSGKMYMSQPTDKQVEYKVIKMLLKTDY